MFLKVHNDGRGRVVAVCDEGLLGKVLEGEGALLDLEKYRGFYGDKKAGAEEVSEALARFDSANIVGKEAVSVALRMGLAGKDDVMYIKRTPYIQIYRL